MSLFSSKVSYLGVDLGSASVKMVELAPEGKRPKLVTFGYAEHPTDIIRTESEETEKRLVALLRKVYDESGVTTKKVVAALPSFSVFRSIISLPAMKQKELSEAIQWEAKKFVPMPVEEMVLDWKMIKEHGVEGGGLLGKNAKGAKLGDAPAGDKPLSQQPLSAIADHEAQAQQGGGESPTALLAKKQSERGEKKNVKVLLTAAPKNLVDRYMRIFQAAELELLSLETESFAIERALVGHDPSPIMIVDIGAVSSDISIVEQGLPILSRSIDVGGITITNAIVNSMGVDVKRAEQFKRDIGFASADGGKGIPKTVENAINPIINEIKYAFDIYLSQGGKTQIEKIVLTGGSAYLPNLVDYLSGLLKIKVFIGDPWARVIYPLELKPMLHQIGPRFSVPIGLAMREIE